MRLNWALIVGLAIFGLLRPVLEGLNVLDLSSWLSSFLMTVMTSIVWVRMVMHREKNLIATLTAVGIVHGVLVIILVVATPLIPIGPEGFLPPMGMVGIMVFNTVWGAVLGIIAQILETTKS